MSVKLVVTKRSNKVISVDETILSSVTGKCPRCMIFTERSCQGRHSSCRVFCYAL